MEPVDFEQKNFNLGAPRGMEKEVGGMPCWKGELGGDPYIISCWKLTAEEIELIKTTGTVWLYINGYNTYPLAMQVKNPFKDEEKPTEAQSA